MGSPRNPFTDRDEYLNGDTQLKVLTDEQLTGKTPSSIKGLWNSRPLITNSSNDLSPAEQYSLYNSNGTLEHSSGEESDGIGWGGRKYEKTSRRNKRSSRRSRRSSQRSKRIGKRSKRTRR